MSETSPTRARTAALSRRKNQNRHKFTSLAVAMFICLYLSSAAAAVIYDNGGWTSSLDIFANISGGVVAEDFSVPQNTQLTDAHVWIWDQSANNATNIALNWYVFADAGGKPGSSPLASGSAANIVQTWTGTSECCGSPYSGMRLNEYGFNLDAPVSLSGGTPYWFGLRAVDATSTFFGANWASADANPGNGVRSDFGTFDNWRRLGIVGTYPEHAFYLTGNPAATPPPPNVSILDLARFSNAAYPNPLPNIGIPNDWHELTDARFNTVGYAARAYKNDSSNQIVLAIAGTDNSVDWIGPNLTFVSREGTPTDDFRNYVSYTATQVQYLRNFYGNDITLTGHSLGGAIAQIIGEAAGLSAISFNAPGAQQVLDINDAKLTETLNQLARVSSTPEIVNYRIYGDLVSTFGDQIGNVVTFEPDVSRDFVDEHTLLTEKHLHSIGTMIERLGPPQAPTTQDTGPTIQSVGRNVILPAILGVGQQRITNLAVEFGIGLLWDPGGADGYSFAVEPGSPRIRSIMFPFLFDDDALFDLSSYLNGDWVRNGLFHELDTYDFGMGGIDMFKFLILDGSSLAPLTDVEPFTFGVTFDSDGIVNGELRSFSTAVPEPATLPLFIVGLFGVAGLGVLRRRN